MSIDLKNDEVVVEPEVQAVLDLFDALGADAKRDALGRLLKRLPDMEWPDLDEETLAEVADETFRAYDRDEGAKTP
ncbi:MAG: hypothetical protein BGO49_05530 [Planctomycetales bacterium 71-10]|nr:MAG: hypothetical protein BGO49_05530 [Planctomycetales bacterium 71-10]